MHTAPEPEPADAAQNPPVPPVESVHRRPIDVAVPDLLPAELSVHFDPAVRRVVICGEFDALAVPMLADVMTKLPDTGPGDTTIDLTDVSFIDAAGLGCVVDFANRLSARGAKLNVVGASPRLRRVFDIVHLGTLLQAA